MCCSGRIVAIHRAANPALGEDEAAAAAVIVNQVLIPEEAAPQFRDDCAPL